MEIPVMRRDALPLFVECLIKALCAKRDHDMVEPYRVDGTIVGNGSQDFTKTYATYAFSINGVPAQLIDCPGIEGDETRFRAIIDKALKKCHLVCYVAREAKGIETTTLERINAYLKENVEVLGIQNIPFNPTKEYEGVDYDCEMREQITKAAENSRNIERALLSVLPKELYVRTLSVSALPGLCATAWQNEETTLANPSSGAMSEAVCESLSTLCRQQRNFYLHTTPDMLMSSSRILSLRDAIEDCCANAPVRIKANAYRRLLQAIREVYLLPLRKDLDALETLKSRVELRVDAYIQDIAAAKDRLSSNMRHAVKDAVDEFYRHDILEKIVYPHIERNVGIDRSELNFELENEKANLFKTANNRIDNAVSITTKEFVECIQAHTDELVHGLQLEIASVGVEIPCLDCGTLGLSDMGNWALNIGGYALSGGSIGAAFGGPVGAMIGAAIGALVGVVLSWLPRWMFRETRINKAKDSARKEIDASARKMFEQLEPGIKQCVEMLSNKTNDGVAKAESKKNAARETHVLVVGAVQELARIERSLLDLIFKTTNSQAL